MTVRKIWVEISVPRLPLLQAEDFVSSLFATIVCKQTWEPPPLFSLYRVFFLHLDLKG